MAEGLQPRTMGVPSAGQGCVYDDCTSDPSAESANVLGLPPCVTVTGLPSADVSQVTCQCDARKVRSSKPTRVDGPSPQANAEGINESVSKQVDGPSLSRLRLL